MNRTGRPGWRCNSNAYERAAFTLVELLVVISIIALLIGLLLPTLGRTKETARRAACGSVMRQIATGLISYGVEHNGMLPYNRRDDLDHHIVQMPKSGFLALARYAGEPLGTTLKCPNDHQFGQLITGVTDNAYLTGYLSLFSHPAVWETPASLIASQTLTTPAGVLMWNTAAWPEPMSPKQQWTSPSRLTDRRKPGDADEPALLADRTDRTSSVNGTTVVRHAGMGPVTVRGQSSPVVFGAEGGNVAYLDGHVRFKRIENMLEHGGYSNEGSSIEYRSLW